MEVQVSAMDSAAANATLIYIKSMKQPSTVKRRAKVMNNRKSLQKPAQAIVMTSVKYLTAKSCETLKHSNFPFERTP